MLDPLFNPKGVAIIGASERLLNIGNRILRNLKTYGYTGDIYPVNPKAAEIEGVRAYHSVSEVPGQVDLAHIVIKNKFVPMAMEDCAKKGVKVVIINTAGFKEIGGEGAELEKKVVELGKKHNIRIFGPNCQGVMNSDPEVKLYANFTFTPLRAGAISLIAQSGGVGEVINNRLLELGAGLRMYASNGNACDISIPEILEYMGNDEKTRVIIVHIESLAEPERFMEVARKVARNKPILAMKTGRTEEGAKAVCSHTGMLLKQDIAIRVIFEKCGIIPFTGHEEICRTALAFAKQPLPQGRNVGIITNTGGPAIIATDECIDAGLKIPDLSPETKSLLKERLFPEASVNNPIDVLATGTPEHYGASIQALLDDGSIDSILLHFVTPFFVDCEAVAGEISRVAKDASKPVLGVVMTNKENWAKTLEIIRASGIPAYDFPETAAQALVHMTGYSEWRRKNAKEMAGTSVELSLKSVEKAREIVRSCEKGKFMPAEAAFELLRIYKIPVAKYAIAEGKDDLLKAAAEIGYPAVLKADSPEIVHKTDEGAIVTGIEDEEALGKHYQDFADRFSKHNPRFLLQEQLKAGTEIVIGAKAEGNLGHIVMFGLGGIFVEVLKDVAFALAPVTPVEAHNMIFSVKGSALLEGVRGRDGADIAALAEIILKVSRMVCDLPEIREMDINPVIAFAPGKGAKAVDVRISL
ncbi:MAG: acetate--CoA ligase family protein [Planctomycetota bacterium]